jgi:1-acyl-sn-glycerol-3-phosphate acyltransferase
MATLLPPPARWKLRLVRHPMADWAHFSIWRLLFKCRMENLPDLSRDSPVIFAGNHGSHFDTLFVHEFLRRRLKRTGRLVAWDQMANIPIVRWLIYGFEAIPVSQHKEALALRKMIQTLRVGSDLWIFSEGQRNDVLGPFRLGAAVASLMTGCAIIPFSLRGVQPLFKNLPWPDRLCGNVSMRFHRALHPQIYLGKFAELRTAAEEMTADVRASVASGIDYPDGMSILLPQSRR